MCWMSIIQRKGRFSSLKICLKYINFYSLVTLLPLLFSTSAESRTKSKKLQYVILTLGWDGVKHLKHADCTWFAYYGWCRARDFLGFVDLVRTQIFPNKTSYPLSKFFRIKLLTPWYAHDIHDFSWPKI